MSEARADWTSVPSPDRYARLLNLLFQPTEQPQASERGES